MAISSFSQVNRIIRNHGAEWVRAHYMIWVLQKVKLTQFGQIELISNLDVSGKGIYQFKEKTGTREDGTC